MDMIINGKEYRIVPGTRSRYVSKDGDVAGFEGRTIIPSMDHDGYLTTKCPVAGGASKDKRWITVHRMVAMAWIDNPNNEEHVNHKNRNRADNRVSNLEWCSPMHNAKHAQGGERCHFSKLTNDNALDIRARFIMGERMSHIAKVYSVTAATISAVVHWRSFDSPPPGEP